MERGKVTRRDSREDYEQLVSVIKCWNERRVELFKITMPSEKLEFEGVMKFYYQYTSKDGQKVATKCIRVQNSATVENVIEVLVQKFRPDLRMLPNLASYVLYEVHNDNGQEDERKMLVSEKPLLVQLKWVLENKDGRFLLRNESVPLQFQSTKLTKAQRKALLDNVKKEQREKKRLPRDDEPAYNGGNAETTRGAIARSLYQIYPPSRFTRSITNPDLVKRWRGEDKRVKDGLTSPIPAEESVQVYADALIDDTPCKSIPVTMATTAAEVVLAAVDQYNLSEEPEQYCLVQVPYGSSHAGLEKILRDTDHPLVLQHDEQQLQLRRKNSSRSLRSLPQATPPHATLVSLTSSNDTLTLTSSSNEIGSHTSTGLCLTSPGICPRHCIIMGSLASGYSIVPLDKGALVIVNDGHVKEPTPLTNNAVVQLGETEVFQLVLPDQTTPNSDQTPPITNQTPPTTMQTTPNSNHNTHSTENLTPVGLMDGAEPWDGAPPTNAVPVSSNKMSQSPPTSIRRRHNSATQLEVEPSDTLPASLIVHPGREGVLLQALTLDANGYILQFKLAPAYSLYMMARHTLYSIPAGGNELAIHQSLVQLLRTACSLIKRAVKDCRSIPGGLAFWLANSSEFLHFLRRDYRLCVLSHEYENPLISITRSSLRHFTECMVREIGLSLPAFWSEVPDSDEEHGAGSQEPDVVPVSRFRKTSITSSYWSATGSKIGRHGRPTITDILTTLEATRSLLQSCRVNATLQTAIFNFLFRYISTRVFNKLVIDPKLCCLAVGGHMTRRLERVKEWAVREGLKVPVEEHLSVVIQAAHLLSSPKLSSDDVQSTLTRCTHLNSRQVSTILQNYRRSEGEESVSQLYISQLLQLVHINVDQKLDPSDINLQEDPNRELPFLLPEHGYSCDTIQGVPDGLDEFLEPVISAGHCQLVVAKDSTRCWIPPRVTNQINSPFSTQASTQMSQTLPRNFGHTSYPHDAYTRPQSAQPGGGGSGSPSSDAPPTHENQSELRIVFVSLDKSPDNSLGINIKEMKINQYGDSGIFILSLSEGGPAHKDGTLQPGDQLLRINNISLQNSNREMVVNVLRSVSERVALTVAKDAAQFYGISMNHSPRYSRKLDNSLPHQFAPPKEGTSHAKKAARREQRSRQQLRQPDYPDHRQGYDYPPTSETPPLSSPSRVPPASSNPQLAKWLHEQQHLVQQKSPTYHKVSIPSPYSESTPSVASHIPEREVPHHAHQYPAYRPGTPPVQDSPDGRHKKLSEYTKFQSIDSPSSKVDSVSGLSETDLSKYFVPSDQLTSDSSYQGASQLPYKDVTHPPGAQGFGPSYHMDKLSMQVTCHTQLTPGGEGPVVSVLEQLEGLKPDMRGLNSSELRQLDLDDIGLLKQRMQLLFYEQEKKKKEGEIVLEDAPKSHAEMMIHHQGKKMNASKEKLDKDVEEIDPDRLLQITKLRNDLESVYKLISDQKKRCREIHFAREREEQSLRQAESKFRAQNSRQFGQFVRPEDESRWHRDQRRRLKEWERISMEKTRRLQQIDIDEHHGRSKLKALEQHHSEIKRQLQALEASGSPAIARTQGGGKVHSHGGIPPKAMRDERDWMGGTRIMSTDSINTSSSWMSGASKGIIGSYGSESNIAGMEPAVEHSPIGLHSETSSPSLLRDSAPYWMPMRARSHSELVVRPDTIHTPDDYRQQDSRLRTLQQEHHRHHKMGTTPSRSMEEKNAQLYHLKLEVQKAREQAKHTSDHAYTDQYRRSYRRDPEPELTTTPESSLSSSTPDVVPTSYTAGPLRLVNHYESRAIHKSLSSVLPTHLEHAEPENSRSMSDLHQHHTGGASYQPTYNHTRQGSRDLGLPPVDSSAVTKGDPSDTLAYQSSRMVTKGDPSDTLAYQSSRTVTKGDPSDTLAYQSSRGAQHTTALVESADKAPPPLQFRKPVKPVGSSGPQRYSRGRPEQLSSMDDKAKTRYQPPSAGARQYRQQTEL